MVVLKVGLDFADSDFAFLTKLLKILDTELKSINTSIKASNDPESEGLCDAGEFIIGSGLVAIQRYLTATRSGWGIDQRLAYSIPLQVNETVTYAQALNSLANYWKHSEEWFEILNGARGAQLPGNAIRTIETLEQLSPLFDYPCADFLAILLKGKDLELSFLLPWIVEWRANLWDSHSCI